MPYLDSWHSPCSSEARSRQRCEIMRRSTSRQTLAHPRRDHPVTINMRERTQAGFSLLAILAAGMAISARGPAALPAGELGRDDGEHSEAALTAQQIHNLIDRVIENQRRNDLLLDQYARTEHSLFHGNRKEPTKDVVSRVIPAGEGILRVELERDGKTSDTAFLDEQWHGVAQALVAEARGRDPHVANFFATRRHMRERAAMISAIGKAFVFRWAGRAWLNGRPVAKLNFAPDPAYRSSARFAALYARSSGTAWVDESDAELIRAEAQLTDDVSWGAGIIAKLYRGGQFTYEQREVAPAVWMPARYSYDFDGRKFLFSLTVHERTEYTDYLRVGPPAEAIGVIGREHPGILKTQN